jgi:Na+-translocating ferredoxin:NAD+ oxidoreductase subunit G
MKKREIIGGIMVLIVITSLSGFLLAQVYKTTAPKIEEQQKAEERKLNREIFPEGENFEKKEENGIEFTMVYDNRGEKIGKIFKISTMGYGGDIVLKVGVDENLNIKGVKVLQQNETPGLGAKITKGGFLSQFKNLEKDSIYLKKDNKNGKIDSVTGATISSRAVTDGMRKLLERIEK